ncbi:MAG: TIGR04100 family radical SAM protein [Oscillospiraceae bacterium]|jgi:radical SAM enzyme (TIGR04100 family)|nr:TIGR04100 family radical SAM protein [Oscillospiraceae bacterium]
MADIVYTFAGKPYLNLTNACPCACTFCIRSAADGVGTAQSLWHQRDPSWEEIKAALEGYDFSRAREAVFCGYGEPFCALEMLQKTARRLKERYPGMALRVNTNGLGDLINQKPTAAALAGLVDAFSISLNAPNAARYQELCRTRFGEAAFDAVLRFARECKSIYPKVILSAVDVITPAEIAQCRKIAEELGLPLRLRHFTT